MPASIAISELGLTPVPTTTRSLYFTSCICLYAINLYIEEVWNKGNLLFIDTNFATDFINHNPFLGQPSRREGVKWVVTTLRNAFSGLYFTIEDMIAENDKVVT
jgi:hypothetical protein